MKMNVLGTGFALATKNYNTCFALEENGSWAPKYAKLMAAKIGELKNCIVLDAKVTVRGRLTATQDAELEACAAAVAASM